MRQQDLQRKRARRQSKRKEARIRAARRGADERSCKGKALEASLRPKAPQPAHPGFFGKLLGVTLGGTPVAPDQTDGQPATILSGSDL